MAPPPEQAPEASPSGGAVKVVASKANNSLLIRATPADYERVEATLADRHGALAGSDRGHDRRGHAEPAALRCPVLPRERQLRGRVQQPCGTTGLRHRIPRAACDCARLQLPVHPRWQQHHHRRAVAGHQRQGALLTVGGGAGQQRGRAHRRRGGAGPDPAAAEHLDRFNILNSIEYRDTGVILQVRPRINSNQAVSLEIAQEVSRVANPNVATLTPTFTQRKVTSRVNIQSGQTVVLGGLIQDSEETGRDRIPVLGEIPCWGACSARPTPRTSVPS